jgi:hypothetical protein
MIQSGIAIMNDDEYRRHARVDYEDDGLVQVREDARIRRTKKEPKGAWVQAWLWVPDEE